MGVYPANRGVSYGWPQQAPTRARGCARYGGGEAIGFAIKRYTMANQNPNQNPQLQPGQQPSPGQQQQQNPKPGQGQQSPGQGQQPNKQPGQQA